MRAFAAGCCRVGRGGRMLPRAIASSIASSQLRGRESRVRPSAGAAECRSAAGGMGVREGAGCWTCQQSREVRRVDSG